MTWWKEFYGTALGKKSVMAVTGIALFGFVLVHMLGNLKTYLGAEALDHYAHWLREVGSPLFPHGSMLWIFRIVLLLAVVIHGHAAITLALLNRRARPLQYEIKDRLVAGYAERTMLWGGIILGLFVVFHIAHLTLGSAWAHPDFVQGEVYHNVVAGFQIWYVSLFYIVAQVALGFHLFHGLWSLFQSLGMSHERYNQWRRNFAVAFAFIVSAGNITVPVAVLTGFLK